MKQTVHKNIELIVLAQEPASVIENISTEGRLNKNAKENSFTFVETMKRKHHTERPRLYESQHVFLTQLDDGSFRLFIKRIQFGSHGINAKALGREISREIAEAVAVADLIINSKNQ